MPYTDLLRVTVFITGAEATALGAITALGANREGSTTTILVAAVWWAVSLAIAVTWKYPFAAVPIKSPRVISVKNFVEVPVTAPPEDAMVPVMARVPNVVVNVVDVPVTVGVVLFVAAVPTFG